MTRYAYYPGCSLETMASEYDVSFRNLCGALGIDLEEVPGWVCCGAGMLGSVSPLLGKAVPLKNLALASEAGFAHLVAPCSACFSQLRRVQRDLAGNHGLREKLESVLEEPIEQSIEVLHPIEMLEREIEGRPFSRPPEDLKHLRVACYYGCLLTRPPAVARPDDAENPQRMERLLSRVGLPTVDWSEKTSCCGAFYAMVNPERVLSMSRTILAEAAAAGANALAVACPICHLNLDARQPEVNAAYGTGFDLPVFYFTQLLGRALGVPDEGLGLWRHVVDPSTLLCRGRASEAEELGHA